MHQFYLSKTENKVYIWKDHEILDEIHISFAKIGFKLKVLHAFEFQGLICQKFEFAGT